MKQALIWLTTAFRRLQRVSETLGRPPREVSAQGLNAINAVAAFDIPAPTPATAPAPVHSIANDPVIEDLTQAVVGHHAAINSIDSRLRSAISGNETDPDDNDSASTDDTDGSVRAANAIRQLSSRTSSGRHSDFRFGQR